MRLLALDLATVTGWAYGLDETYESGFKEFRVDRGDSPGIRFVRFRRWLHELLVLSNGQPSVDLVVYEQPFVMRSGAAAEISLGFATRVQELCAERNITHATVNGSRLKKWTTGAGNAKKDAMVKAVLTRWEPDRAELDDNEADAIALYHYALETLAVKS